MTGTGSRCQERSRICSPEPSRIAPKKPSELPSNRRQNGREFSQETVHHTAQTAASFQRKTQTNANGNTSSLTQNVTGNLPPFSTPPETLSAQNRRGKSPKTPPDKTPRHFRDLFDRAMLHDR